MQYNIVQYKGPSYASYPNTKMLIQKSIEFINGDRINIKGGGGGMRLAIITLLYFHMCA